VKRISGRIYGNRFRDRGAVQPTEMILLLLSQILFRLESVGLYFVMLGKHLSRCNYKFFLTVIIAVFNFVFRLQMPLVTIAADTRIREKRLQDVQNFCSPQLVSAISILLYTSESLWCCVTL
jgi:hypothetical protein